METKYYKYCLRCGKRLTKPEYRLRGYGKDCWEIIQIKNNNKLFTNQAVKNRRV